MDAYINHTNFIHISESTSLKNGQLFSVGYDDLTDKFIAGAAQDVKVKTIQVSGNLPVSAYKKINDIFRLRPDMYFRVFGLYGNKKSQFDFSALKELTDVERYVFDFDMKEKPEGLGFEFISDISNLKALRLNLFDWYDYSFIDSLSPNLEELSIYADTMGKTIQFDCRWLLRYKKLKSLFLGKKARKNLQEIGKIDSLRELFLHGIKVDDFSFLFELPLESFHLLWCGNDNLSQLAQLSGLKKLELWRIMKLTNIDFLSQLSDLEIIKLRDLKHITSLPDLSRLCSLKEILVDNVPLDYATIDKRVQGIIKIY